jgi:hypothetical protein
LFRDINYFLNNYLDEKIENLCDDLLARQLETTDSLSYRSYGISFDNIFSELIFVILYEDKLYESFQKNLFELIYSILNTLSDEEIMLLSIGVYRSEIFDGEVRDYQEITKKIMELAITKALNHISEQSDEIYENYVQRIKKDISDFGFSGSVIGDYNTQNYWEDFCVITQESYDYLYDICYDDIYGYILKILDKSPKIDLKLLYSGTAVYVNEIENPLSIYAVSNDSIADKLFNMISYMAASEDIMHILFPDEYEEDEDV